VCTVGAEAAKYDFWRTPGTAETTQRLQARGLGSAPGAAATQRRLRARDLERAPGAARLGRGRKLMAMQQQGGGISSYLGERVVRRGT
jgi:hypothetical protein